MQIRITQLTEQELPAVRAFNERIAREAPFFLPSTIPHQRGEGDASAAITWTHYLAMEDAAVRGGFMLMEQPAFVEGEVRRVTNSQSMLSEGITDRKYGIVSIQMLKHIERNKPYPFMVGMGNLEASLPRLLRGAGWTVCPVPFFFRVQKAGNFLRQMQIFHDGGRRQWLARLAAASGAGGLALTLLQRRSMFGGKELKGLKIDPIDSWGRWAEEVWRQYQSQCSFAVVRDLSTLDLLYPLDDRIKAWVVHRDSVPIGWGACLDTQMRDDKYFGNLRVGTILDCISAPEHATSVVKLVADELARGGADLLISNQSHSLWKGAFRAAGFLTTRSNYLLATSKKFTAAIEAGGGEERIHLTRGDSDGRIHL